MKAELFTDGGARLNPGLAGIGVLLRTPTGEVIEEIARPIGTATNNAAEYVALIEGLELALEHGVKDLVVYIDSPVVYGHLNGWQVKSQRLQLLLDKLNLLQREFKSCTISRVERAGNAEADRLANQGMDESTARMFTIHLDLLASSGSATCSKCLESHEVRWTGPSVPESSGLDVWKWMGHHARTAH